MPKKCTLEAFNGLKTRIWKVFCFGNHDYGEYVTWPSEAAKENNLKLLRFVSNGF
jgi:hypothetical protein